MPEDVRTDLLLNDEMLQSPLLSPRRQRTASTVDCIHSSPSAVRVLPIVSIRKDGQTQHRAGADTGVVGEYAALMRANAVFPPVTVWWDGGDYWLSDGFQRLAAAERVGLLEFPAEIYQGSLIDAQWDSYAANAAHGLRRSSVETRAVIQAALRHANSAKLSNVLIAKHLHVPEATVRYWRKRLSSQGCEDGDRVVTRGGTTYTLATTNIGKDTGYKRTGTRRDLRAELGVMKEKASPTARRLLNIIEHWVVAQATSTECLAAIEGVVRGWNTPDHCCPR
jgi:hypothetical protein